MLFEQRAVLLWLMLPSLLVLALLTGYPLVSVLLSAVTESDSQGTITTFVGLAHFRALLDDFFFVTAVRNTLVFTLVASSSQVLLGLALALLFYRPFTGRRWLIPLLIYPMMLSTLVCSAIWRAWYHYDVGLINRVLMACGLPAQEWLSEPSRALYAIALVDTWQWTPMAFLILLAGLQSIPREVQEAAMVDGARGWQRFCYITLPLLARPLLLVVLLRSIDTFKLFDKAYVMTGGGPGNATETLSMLVYKYGFQFFDQGLASAAALLMLLISITMTLIYAHYLARGKQR